MKNTLSKEFIEKLKELAKRVCWSDFEEFNPMDSSGGNYDDAYYGGAGDGETLLAREILDELK